MTKLRLKPQEIPVNDLRSNCFFRPTFDKPVVATPAALAAYGDDIHRCIAYLCDRAEVHNGLDYLQVFESHKPEPLWFIEDGPGGAITALLPSDY
jgi:hypothetical protein